MTEQPDPPAAATPRVVHDPALVAFADCDLIPISQAMTLVINRHNGMQQIMMPQVVDGLKTCVLFDTLERHAAHLAGTRPELGGNQAMAASALSHLNETGMLQRAADVCARLAAPPPPLAPTRVFVITCDRPEAVQRLLESMLAVGQLTRHDALLLVDDSRNRANRAANREAVVRFNQRSAKSMGYFGEEAQRKLLDAVTGALPDHAEAAHFLLDPGAWEGRKTFGRSRTLCLLLSVGCRALVMDDDILCQAVLPPVRDTGVGFGSGSLRKAAFYASEQELRSSGAVAAFDPLGGHASLLGTSLGHALVSLNDGPLQEEQLAHTNAALMNVLRADSPVLVTQCGSLGDPGTGPHWGIHLDADSVARLLGAEHGVTRSLEDRLTWLGSSRPNVFKMSFMSQLTGLDNSTLLPPYFPAYRGEDSLFGAMVAAMYPLGVALEYPWSVPHLPLEPRNASLASPVTGTGGGIALFARYLTARIDYRDTSDAGQNLAGIAREARRMAARSDADLLLDYRTELAQVHADLLHALTQQFEGAKQLPAGEWQQYLARGIEEVQRALTVSHSPTAIEGVPRGATEAEVLAEFRRMACGFANALTGWEAMRDVAAGEVNAMLESRELLPQ